MNTHKKYGTSLTTVVFSLTTLFATVQSHAKMPVRDLAHNEQHLSAPKDMGVVNEERIVYWLIKRGELAKDATPSERAKAVQNYIGGTNQHNNEYINEIAGKPVINFAKQHQHIKSTKQQKSSLQSKSQSDQHEVNVLTLLIDFPDLPHDNNQLTSSDTAMYYDNYSTEHYANLMYSPTGFEGPNNESLLSAHQYYEQESGGTFEFNGEVFGWVTADNNAAYYGANDANGNDQAATDLVKEALDKAVVKYNIDLSKFDLVDPADLDNDGIIDEPDGYIDYIMVFHSSVGADAGGGILGADAIWAHRWNINNYSIPNTNYYAHGYTIQGIDSAIGVVSHEFGHMVANLKDEYDTNNSIPNSPVGFWSLMSGGSWGGSVIPGSEPTGFSPLAKVEMQEAFGGNWHNSISLDLSDIQQNTQTLELVEAVNSKSGKNLVDISLPASGHQVVKPAQGIGQFHSSMGDDLSNSMSFEVDIPQSVNSILKTQAYWDIEKDWDYAQILVNGDPIPATNTVASNYGTVANYYLGLVEHYITGKSSDIDHGWLSIEAELSDYAGQTVSVTIQYITDSYTGGIGLFIDNIVLINGSSETVIAKEDLSNIDTLNGFSLIDTFVEPVGKSKNYYIQLRSFKGVDSGLDGAGYDHGVLMWLANDQFYYNHSSVHPGEGFLSVIDADQNIIEDETYGVWWTTNQIRDAVFSIFEQRNKSADNHLTAISEFDDKNSYIHQKQPESGTKLPIHGLKMKVLEQDADSSSATIELSADTQTLTAFFAIEKTDKYLVSFNNKSFGGDDWIAYEWDFGDGSNRSFDNGPSHIYEKTGEYTVVLQATDSSGAESRFELNVATEGAHFDFTASALEVTFVNNSLWGQESLLYQWDFGDGTESTEVAPVHHYQAPGKYTVMLTATSETGQVLRMEKLIDVMQVEPPESAFIVDVNNLKVHAKNQTTKGAGKLIYTWDFGDGSYKRAGTSPVHTYQKTGIYNIQLTVRDELGRESVSTSEVNVTAPADSASGGGIGILTLLLVLVARRKFN